MNSQKITKWLSDHIYWVFIVFIILLIAIPYMLTRETFIGFHLGSTAHEIGTAINGLTAPFIGLFTALLLYITFKSQHDFNQKYLDSNNFSSLLKALSALKENEETLSFDSRPLSISAFYKYAYHSFPKKNNSKTSITSVHTTAYKELNQAISYLTELDLLKFESFINTFNDFIDLLKVTELDVKYNKVLTLHYKEFLSLDFENLDYRNEALKNEKSLEIIEIYKKLRKEDFINLIS